MIFLDKTIFKKNFFFKLLDADAWLYVVKRGRKKKLLRKKTVERKYWNVSEQTMMDLLETSATTLQAKEMAFTGCLKICH